LLNDVYADNFVSILATRTESSKVKQEESSAKSSEGGVAATVGPYLASLLSKSGCVSNLPRPLLSANSTEVLLRVFDMKEYIRRLRELLQQVGIRHLYVFVDDFQSCLSSDALVVMPCWRRSTTGRMNSLSSRSLHIPVASYLRRN